MARRRTIWGLAMVLPSGALALGLVSGCKDSDSAKPATRVRDAGGAGSGSPDGGARPGDAGADATVSNKPAAAPVTDCPVSTPQAGVLCGVEIEGVVCEYGSDPTPGCNKLAACADGGFELNVPGKSATCPTPALRLSATCPRTLAATRGASCEKLGEICAFIEGECACTNPVIPVPADAGETPADAGETPPADAGEAPPADAGAPTDAEVTPAPADADPAPSAEDASPPGEGNATAEAGPVEEPVPVTGVVNQVSGASGGPPFTCTERVAGCPRPRPRLGAICNARNEGVLCDYGPCPTKSLFLECTGRRWTQAAVACPGTAGDAPIGDAGAGVPAGDR